MIEDKEMPPIMGRGRKKGSGDNMQLLNRLEVGGNPVFGVPELKMFSIRSSAFAMGIRIKVRQMPGPNGEASGKYAIQRLS